MESSNGKKVVNYQKIYKLFPKDALVIQSIYKESGINEYDPLTINYLLNFIYHQAVNLISDAKYYALIASRRSIIKEDAILTLQMKELYNNKYVPREELTKTASKINSVALPTIKIQFGLRLPADKYCLLSKNYKMKHRYKLHFGNKAKVTPYNKLYKNIFQNQYLKL